MPLVQKAEHRRKRYRIGDGETQEYHQEETSQQNQDCHAICIHYSIPSFTKNPLI